MPVRSAVAVASPGYVRRVTSLDSSSIVRRLAIGGIVGPSAFITAWAVGAFTNDRQLSAIDDAISQLAHVDSNTRWLMTTGFITFGVGVWLFAVSARSTLGAPTAAFLGATAASTLAIALLPIGASDTIDQLHGIAAAAGYLTLIGAPLAARGSLRRLGAHRLASAGVAAAAVAAVSLGASLALPTTGAFQRLGLTVVDAWIITTATLLATGRLDVQGGSGTQPSELAR